MGSAGLLAKQLVLRTLRHARLRRSLVRRDYACLVAVVLASMVSLANTAVGNQRTVPGQLLVKFKEGVPESERAATCRMIGSKRLEAYSFIRTELLEIEEQSVDAAIDAFQRLPGVEYAEPNFIVHATYQPDDPQLNLLWGLRNTGQTGGTPGADIRATLAWNVFRGDPSLRIGVIDTGIDYDHPDLAASIWTNPGEIPGNGIDDDGNGYLDDVHGFDTKNQDGDPDDDHGHGTHVAGTLAAVGNNGLGVVGVAWRCRLVAIKFLDASGSGTTSGAIAALEYAIRVGVTLTNNSWAGGGFSQAFLDAIEAAGAANQLFVAAAGNDASDNDATPTYPAAYASPYIVAVAATDANDQLAGFSNFGAQSVHLAAPGVGTFSCMPGGGYQVFSGTSMATPHVAGVAALVYGFTPGITNLQVKSRILQSAVPIQALAARCQTGARLDAFLALAEPDSIAPGVMSDLAVVETNSTSLVLAWTAPGDDGEVGSAAGYDLRVSTQPIDASNFTSATRVPAPEPQPAGVLETIEVTGLAYETMYFFAVRAHDEWEQVGSLSNVAAGMTIGIPDIAVDVESLVVALEAPATAMRLVTVSNVGSGTLDYAFPLPELLPPTSALVQKVHEAIELPKGIEDARSGGLVAAGSGGPDLFGYRWFDSDEPGGPIFEWLDITSLGSPIPLTRDDQTITGIPLGFDFPFYGNTYTTVNVCSNGFLSFTWPGTFYLNQPLPNHGLSVPANLVAPLWDDFDFSQPGARAYSFADGERFIVEYVDVPRYGEDDPFTFEVVFYSSGEILYQYLDLGSTAHSATVGIQDATRTVGLQVAFNAFYLHEGLALRIHPIPQWVTVTPPSAGRLGAGKSQAIEVTLDPTGLATGIHRARLLVSSNDPDENPRMIPVRLVVTAVADAEEALAPASGLSLRLVGAHPSMRGVRFTVSIPRRENLELCVFDVRGAVVRRLLHGLVEPGQHAVEWDGYDDMHRRAGAGIYLFRLRAGAQTAAKKVVLWR